MAYTGTLEYRPGKPGFSANLGELRGRGPSRAVVILASRAATGGVKSEGGGNGGEDLIEERRPAFNEPRVEALMRLDAAAAVAG